MKTLFTLATAALLTWAAAAPVLAAPPANLNVTSDRGQAFSLVLDGRLLTRPLARQVHVGLLQPGQHWADFSVPTGYGPPLRLHTTVWLQPGSETSYVLIMSPYGPQLRQVAAVALGGPAYGRGGYYGNGQAPGGYPGGYYSNGQNVPYGRPNAPYSSQQPSYDNRNMPYNGQSAPQGGQGGYPDNGQNSAGSQNTYPGGGQYTPPNSPAPGPGNSGYPAPGGSYQPGAASPGNQGVLSPNDAAGLMDDMRRQPSDDERIDMAKQTLDQSSLRSEDLAGLMQTLTDEAARIELAEFGYAHVTDPQNFSRVYGALRSSTSVREVQQALRITPR